MSLFGFSAEFKNLSTKRSSRNAFVQFPKGKSRELSLVKDMDLQSVKQAVESRVGPKANAGLQALAAAAAAAAVTLLGVEQYGMGVVLAGVAFGAYWLYEKLPA